MEKVQKVNSLEGIRHVDNDYLKSNDDTKRKHPSFNFVLLDKHYWTDIDMSDEMF